MRIRKLGDGEVVSARAVQLTDPQNFLPRCWRLGGNGLHVRKLTNILEMLVGGAHPLHQPGAVLVSSFVVYRRCFDAVVTAELADSVI